MAELGTSLFEIALEQTFILVAMALNKKKSEERRANWQSPNSERFAHARYQDAIKMVKKRIKMHDFNWKVKFKDRKVKFLTKKLSFRTKKLGKFLMLKVNFSYRKIKF